MIYTQLLFHSVNNFKKGYLIKLIDNFFELQTISRIRQRFLLFNLRIAFRINLYLAKCITTINILLGKSGYALIF